jgi:hypothetical protein
MKRYFGIYKIHPIYNQIFKVHGGFSCEVDCASWLADNKERLSKLEDQHRTYQSGEYLIIPYYENVRAENTDTIQA